MKNAGLEPTKYRYYDPKTCSFNVDFTIEDLQNAPDKSVFMFHACAHNPTGCDPTNSEWDRISEVAKKKNHVLFLDCAYQVK